MFVFGLGGWFVVLVCGLDFVVLIWVWVVEWVVGLW